MANATAIKDSVEVVTAGQIEGTFYVVTNCADYDTFSHLPAAVAFEGREYAKTGWNSDKGVAYFQTNKGFARKVR